jgi:hypothetical protein
VHNSLYYIFTDMYLDFSSRRVDCVTQALNIFFDILYNITWNFEGKKEIIFF